MILPVSKLCLAQILKECRRLGGVRARSVALACLAPTRLQGILISSLLACVLAIPVHAQVAATISGTIEDPSGAGVGGAKVTVTNAETGASRETTSGEAGHFNVLSLAPGPHEVKVEKSGFQSAVRTG